MPRHACFLLLDAFLLIAMILSALGSASPEDALLQQLRSLTPEGKLGVHKLVVEVLSLQQVAAEVQQGADATTVLQERLQASQQLLHSLLPQLGEATSSSLEGLQERSTAALLASLAPRGSSRWRALTLVNIAWFVGCVLVVLAALSLVGVYLAAIIILIPKEAWEALGWTASGLVLHRALRCSPASAPFVALTGLLMLTACMGATIHLHFKQLFESREWAVSATLAFLALVYGALAIRLQASLLGTISVWWAMSALGFSIMVFPFLTVLGFRSGMARPFAASLMLILVFLPFKVSPEALPTPTFMKVFEAGVWLWCSLVLNLANLIMAHEQWARPSRRQDAGLDHVGARLSLLDSDLCRYALSQLPSLAVLGGTLAAGILLDIEQCRAVGSVFFFLWFCSKLAEYDWKRVGFAWAALAFGCVLWAAAWAVNTWPHILMPAWKSAAV